MPSRIVIASRESRLAMWQSEHVREQLVALYPRLSVAILGMTTQGDRILDVALAKIGGKGLFVKELENALAEGRADIAVHSAKDVPVLMPAGFVLAAVLEREDARDAFVSNRYARLEDLPGGAIVGTSSLRRESQLRERFPQLDIRPLRGNLDTRLAKLDRGDYDAIVLACAGLKRLGLESRVRSVIEPAVSVPAVGQGALAIECRADRPDVIALLAPLVHRDTAIAVAAERAVSLALGGSCQLPLAAHAKVQEGRLFMNGIVASLDGRKIARASVEGIASAPEATAHRLVAELRAHGAEEILAAVAASQ